MANFTIGELCASKVAQEKGIDNTWKSHTNLTHPVKVF